MQKSLGEEDVFIIDEYECVPEEDIQAIRVLFETSFPLRYGDQFYNALTEGAYAGRPLLTCIARRQGVGIIGAACATKEEGGGGVVESGTKTYLMTLAVEPTERRRGIAAALVNRISNWASKDPSCTCLYLHVIDYNDAAMKFYSKLGLQNFGSVPEFYPINGTNHDAYIYVLYMNGGTPPPPEPPSIIESVWDWFSRAWTRVSNLAFGANEEEEEEDVNEEDLV